MNGLWGKDLASWMGGDGWMVLEVWCTGDKKTRWQTRGRNVGWAVFLP